MVGALLFDLKGKSGAPLPYDGKVVLSGRKTREPDLSVPIRTSTEAGDGVCPSSYPVTRTVFQKNTHPTSRAMVMHTSRNGYLGPPRVASRMMPRVDVRPDRTDENDTQYGKQPDIHDNSFFNGLMAADG